MKTGAYLRIQRAGKWVNVDIVEMTEDEILAVFSPDRAAKWIVFLVKWIREHVVFGEDEE
jgi:hypothetical protein